MVPRGSQSFEALKKEWEKNHELLRSFLEKAGPECAGKALFAHPVSGPITVSQSLHMLEMHLDRHSRQIKRIEADLRSAA